MNMMLAAAAVAAPTPNAHHVAKLDKNHVIDGKLQSLDKHLLHVATTKVTEQGDVGELTETKETNILNMANYTTGVKCEAGTQVKLSSDADFTEDSCESSCIDYAVANMPGRGHYCCSFKYDPPEGKKTECWFSQTDTNDNGSRRWKSFTFDMGEVKCASSCSNYGQACDKVRSSTGNYVCLGCDYCADYSFAPSFFAD